MKNIIPSVQTELAAISSVKYVDENWGQLDTYSPNFPVKWPCVLIDVSAAQYSNVGRDNSQSPVNRQMSTYVLEITIANQKLTNSSSRAPQGQKDIARSIWDIINLVHEKIQGFSPNPMAGKLIRVGHARVRRDDGVQEYKVMYSGSITDV